MVVKIEDAEEYGSVLQTMASECNELKGCAHMISVEVRRYIGFASVEEVFNKLTLWLIKSKIMILENNRFSADGMLFNINGFFYWQIEQGLEGTVLSVLPGIPT